SQTDGPISNVRRSCHESPDPPSTKKISSAEPWTCAGVDHFPGSTWIRSRPAPTEPAAVPRSVQVAPRWPKPWWRDSTSSQCAIPTRPTIEAPRPPLDDAAVEWVCPNQLRHRDHLPSLESGA